MIAVIIAGVLALAFFAFTLLSSNQPATPTDKIVALQLRLETLQSIQKANHRNLRDNTLRSTSSASALYFTNTLRDLDSAISTAGIDMKKALTKERSATEKTYGTELSDKLAEAKLNVHLDSTYAREMAYELRLVSATLASLERGTKSKSLREFTANSQKNLTPLIDNYEKFSATKE